MKKFLALVLAAMMLMAMASASAEGTEITYWSMWSSTEPQAIAMQEIIDQYTDIGFIPAKRERIPAVAIDVGVYSGYNALSPRFLVAGSTVDLSGKK